MRTKRSSGIGKGECVFLRGVNTMNALEDSLIKSKLARDGDYLFAVEMDHFEQRIKTDQTPGTPGEKGLQDQRIMEAIYRAAAGGAPSDSSS